MRFPAREQANQTPARWPNADRARNSSWSSLASPSSSSGSFYSAFLGSTFSPPLWSGHAQTMATWSDWHSKSFRLKCTGKNLRSYGNLCFEIYIYLIVILANKIFIFIEFFSILKCLQLVFYNQQKLLKSYHVLYFIMFLINIYYTYY